MKYVIDDINTSLVNVARGNRVLYIGAGDGMGGLCRHAADTKRVASCWFGLDLHGVPELDDVGVLDLNDITCASFDAANKLKNPNVIILKEVLEHIGNPLQLLKVLKDRVPCLLCITVPNGASLGRIFRFVFRQHTYAAEDGQHVCVYNRTTLHNILQQAGYHSIYIQPYAGNTITRIVSRVFPHLASGFAACGTPKRIEED